MLEKGFLSVFILSNTFYFVVLSKANENETNDPAFTACFLY